MDVEAEAHTFLEQPTGYLYRGLIDHALGECRSALLVVRPSLGLSSQALGVLKQLEHLLDEKVDASEWPGTKLFNGSAVLFRYTFNAECAEILKQNANGLYEWLQPELPEDLCLLRADSIPWLVSISHEGDGCLYLAEAEISRLASALPELAELLMHDSAPNTSEC
jgi:hypothetical protein